MRHVTPPPRRHGEWRFSPGFFHMRHPIAVGQTGLLTRMQDILAWREGGKSAKTKKMASFVGALRTAVGALASDGTRHWRPRYERGASWALALGHMARTKLPTIWIFSLTASLPSEKRGPWLPCPSGRRKPTYPLVAFPPIQVRSWTRATRA